jgi:hypothetical protein
VVDPIFGEIHELVFPFFVGPWTATQGSAITMTLGSNASVRA